MRRPGGRRDPRRQRAHHGADLGRLREAQLLRGQHHPKRALMRIQHVHLHPPSIQRPTWFSGSMHELCGRLPALTTCALLG